MVDPIKKPVPIPNAALRLALLTRLQNANKEITATVIEAAQIEDIRLVREVLLRMVTAMSHQTNIVVGVAAAAGIAQADVERATRLGQNTSSASLTKARTDGEREIDKKGDAEDRDR